MNNRCPFCQASLEKPPFMQYGFCSNPRCTSHQFIIGNRVGHQTRPELGIGIIKDIKKIAKLSFSHRNQALGSYLPTVPEFETSQTSTQVAEPRSSFSEIETYIIDFPGYTDTSFLSNEIFHYIWEIDRKIRYHTPLTPHQVGVGTIVHITLIHPKEGISYEVLTSDGKIIQLPEMAILYYIDSPLEEFFQTRMDSPARFLLRFWSTQLLDLYSSNRIKVITNARLSLLPHQISVAHQLLEQGYARMILADEVGLGKTIEAGIYIKEMLARQLASRILIITPATITGQWEFEMKNKFHLSFDRITAARSKNIAINFQTGNLIDEKTGEDLLLCTVTLQYARLQQCKELLNGIEWDIVIFDEAHHLRRYLTNQKTGTYRTTLAYDLATELAERTKSLLLLTATPIQLHALDLYNLICLVNPFAFPDFEAFEQQRKQLAELNLAVKNLQHFTRLNSYERKALGDQLANFGIHMSEPVLEEKLRFTHRRRELITVLEKQHFLRQYVIRNRRRIVFPHHPIKRLPQVVQVELTTEELEIYNKIHLYLAKIYSQNYTSGATAIGFIMVILQKLLTSSPPAVMKSMKKRILFLEENGDMLQKMGMEKLIIEDLTDEDSSLDVFGGLEELELEDRMIVQKRKQTMMKKSISPLNIHDHIKILKEFVSDLNGLTVDSKADALFRLIAHLMQQTPQVKILLFTQFKETLFYLSHQLEAQGYRVSQFYGDLTEDQKNQAVVAFRRDVPIMISTEIGGEGRNFQFCHILINYDLPWNPMRLEQRIGRLDRIGQVQNVEIYNFFIQDTVESSIVAAIIDRIHLFEESIGALEPILGSLEHNITDLILKKSDTPLTFRIDEVITRTTEKIETAYDKLEDLILDKHSFQYEYLSREIDNPLLLTSPDLYSFFRLMEQFMKVPVEEFDSDSIVPLIIQIEKDPQEKGMHTISISEPFQRFLRISDRVFRGVFELDLARLQEEADFFALGHPLVMSLAEWGYQDAFRGWTTILPLNGFQLRRFLDLSIKEFISTSEKEAILGVLDGSTHGNLFIFEISFIGVIIEKVVVPLVITDEYQIFPIFSELIYRPHNLFPLLSPLHPPPLEISMQLRDIITQCFTHAQQYTKTWIQTRVSDLTTLNQNRYVEEKAKILRFAQDQERYLAQTITRLSEKLRQKKIHLPTLRQREYTEKLQIQEKREQRLAKFHQTELEIHYYEREIQRWMDLLESISFDTPARLDRLHRHRKLSISATLIGYARLWIT